MRHIVSNHQAVMSLLSLAALASILASLPNVASAATTSQHVIIVANNHALDDGVPSLSYADDDGARYYELFGALGAKVQLFAVLDGDAQERFPQAARAAKPPTLAAIEQGLESAFAEMRRAKEADAAHVSELYFVYSGHGDVGASREGYLNFLDERFRRRDLYRQVIAASPATWNHIILDACNAYFVVNKRGGRASDKTGNYAALVKGFMASEELRSYPNTGIILAASSESETHEWSRWGSGIFSHELRSALLGAADVDGDSAITYGEAAAFIEAANADIDDPKARLRVFAHPPALYVQQPLGIASRLRREHSLRFEVDAKGGMPSQHFFVEDARGVRVADLHPSGEQQVILGLVGSAPFYVRTATSEAKVHAGHWSTATMAFERRATSSRGSLDQTFHRKLYGTSFGPQFYRGFMSLRGSNWDGWYGSLDTGPTLTRVAEPTAGSSVLTGLAWTSIGVAGASAAGAVMFTMLAGESRDRYDEAGEPQTALRYKQETDRRADVANTLYVITGGLAGLGVGLFAYDWSAGDDSGGENDGLAVGVLPTLNGVSVSIAGWIR